MPKRSYPIKTGSLEEKSNPNSKVLLYAQLEQARPLESRDSDARAAWARHRGAVPVSGSPSLTAQNIPMPGKTIVYSELSLSDCRSKSLPLLDNNTRNDSSYKLDTFTAIPPQRSPKLQRENAKKTSSHEVPSHSHSLDKLSDHSFYQLAGKSVNHKGKKQQEKCDATYAEVPCEPRLNLLLLENTYEQIPESRTTTNPKENSVQGNTYETLEDFKPKPSESTWGFKVSTRLWYAYVTRVHAHTFVLLVFWVLSKVCSRYIEVFLTM